jgi:hypothetical protein
MPKVIITFKNGEMHVIYNRPRIENARHKDKKAMIRRYIIHGNWVFRFKRLKSSSFFFSRVRPRYYIIGLYSGTIYLVSQTTNSYHSSSIFK